MINMRSSARYYRGIYRVDGNLIKVYVIVEPNTHGGAQISIRHQKILNPDYLVTGSNELGEV